MPTAAPIGADKRTYPIGFFHISWSKNERQAVGGLLVTDNFGVPLEFRITTRVQANELQALLLGASLRDHFARDLIGTKLFNKLENRPLLCFVRAHHLLPVASGTGIPSFLLEESPRTGEPLRATPPADHPEYADLLDLRTIHSDMFETFARIERARQVLAEREDRYALPK